MSESEFATPSFAAVIQDAIDAGLDRVNTCMPAQVVKVDVTKGVCDVQPCLKRVNVKGVVVQLPVIVDVPIANYRAGKAAIYLPVKVGDYVELRFSQRSLDEWKTKGGVVDPQDTRKFQLSDAIAYPGVNPDTEPPEGADADDIIIKNDQTVITITPDGKFKFVGGDDEIIDLLVQALDKIKTVFETLSTTTTNTQLGPQPLLDADAIGTIAGDVDEIKTKLEAMKG